MIILAIDVGKTTGVCWLFSDGEVGDTFKVASDEIYRSALARWKSDMQITPNIEWKVVVEYPAMSNVSWTPELEQAINAIHDLFPDAYQVRPGVWKNSAIAQQALPKEFNGTKLSQHEKDAINIARWYRQKLVVNSTIGE